MNRNRDESAIVVNVEEDLSSLLRALSKRNFNNRQSGFVIVTDSQRKAIGVVTDSDLRKFATKYERLPANIPEVLNRDFIWISSSLKGSDIPREVARQMQYRGWETSYPARYIPVLSEDLIPVNVIDSFDLHQELRKHRDSILVVGLGYVGLTFALAFAEAGNNIIGIDSDTNKLAMLNKGDVPFFESGLSSVLKSRKDRNLHFNSSLTDVKRSNGQSAIVVICLPTPLDLQTKTLDLSPLYKFIPELTSFLRQGDTVVLRSTVPVGTGRMVYKKIEQELNWTVGSDFYYVSAPERTVEGNALREIRDLPQIIGGATEACSDKGHEIFEDVTKVILQVSSLEASELIKITGNAYRDYIFAFANYLAEQARRFNVDVDEVIEKSNWGYPRSNIPSPSPGVGGPCLTKDPYLFDQGEGLISPIISARSYNESVPDQVVDFLVRQTNRRDKALIVGLTFKGDPPTDDIRNSTNLEIASKLKSFFKETEEWDAVLQHTETGFSHKIPADISNEFDLIAVLNNHNDNVKFVINCLENQKSSFVTLFDPWRLFDVPSLLTETYLRSINYVTMSSATVYSKDEL